MRKLHGANPVSSTDGKMKTVLDLAKWKVGDKPFWIVSRPMCSNPIPISDEDEWAFSEEVHPKTLYKYGIVKTWPYRHKLPRLHACDFQLIVEVLEMNLAIEPFEIGKVIRCPHTGEFICANSTGEEWMGESDLFETVSEARRERARIMALIREWTNRKPH